MPEPNPQVFLSLRFGQHQPYLAPARRTLPARLDRVLHGIHVRRRNLSRRALVPKKTTRRHYRARRHGPIAQPRISYSNIL